MSDDSPVHGHGTRLVLRDRSFRLFIVSRFCSGAAMTLLRAAFAWHVFALTHSAFHLGLIGLVQFVPALLLTLLGGAVADTYDRRRIIMLAQVVPLLCDRCCSSPRRRGGVVTLPLLYGADPARRHGGGVRQPGARRAAADPGAARPLSARRDHRLDRPGARLRDRPGRRRPHDRRVRRRRGLCRLRRADRRLAGQPGLRPRRGRRERRAAGGEPARDSRGPGVRAPHARWCSAA